MKLTTYTIPWAVILSISFADVISLRNYKRSLSSAFGAKQRIVVRRPFQQRGSISQRNVIMDAIKSGLQHGVDEVQEEVNHHMPSAHQIETKLLRTKRNQDDIQNGIPLIRKSDGTNVNNAKAQFRRQMRSRVAKRGEQFSKRLIGIYTEGVVPDYEEDAKDEKSSETAEDEIENEINDEIPDNEKDNVKGKAIPDKKVSTESKSTQTGDEIENEKINDEIPDNEKENDKGKALPDKKISTETKSTQTGEDEIENEKINDEIPDNEKDNVRGKALPDTEEISTESKSTETEEDEVENERINSETEQG
ncbi:uncharacterized protein LOC142358376 [Convolutriloba macropyga]|uniref:uncharacterized protein LOC142358376 n=1 Tax=Convolutriloba macropyga TaxID=536237 RepID=UPI003F51B364